MLQLNEHDFVPSDASVQYFQRAANGRWFNWLSAWKWSSDIFFLYDIGKGQVILSVLMEDALIAFGRYKLQNDPAHAKEVIILLSSAEQSMLKVALEERLPRVEGEEAKLLAEMLIKDLYEQLKEGKEIHIDDGVVTFNLSENCLQMRILQGEGVF